MAFPALEEGRKSILLAPWITESSGLRVEKRGVTGNPRVWIASDGTPPFTRISAVSESATRNVSLPARYHEELTAVESVTIVRSGALEGA